MPPEFKVCPSCREEFTLAAVDCGGCGVVLVYPGDLDGDESEEDQEIPQISDLACVRVGPLPWTRALSAALSEAEIAHRVAQDTRTEQEGGVGSKRFGGEDVYGTWVLPEEQGAALEIDAMLFAHLQPERADDIDEDEACPACHEAISPAVLECPSCGLTFG